MFNAQRLVSRQVSHFKLDFYEACIVWAWAIILENNRIVHFFLPILRLRFNMQLQ